MAKLTITNCPYRVFKKDEEGNLKEIFKYPKDETIKVYNKDGVELSRKTGKPKRNSGFNTNPENIYKRETGRPKGTRNKSTLAKAIERLEAFSLESAEIIVATALGNKDFLEVDEIKLSDRVGASKFILIEAPKMKRALEGAEEGKGSPKGGEGNSPEGGSPEEAPAPLIKLTVNEDGKISK